MTQDVFEMKLSWWDKLTAPVHRLWWRICDCWKDLGYRRQRFKRGYASCDVWELRSWFVNTLRPMLEDLRVHHTGCPDELTDEEWEAILGKMIKLLAIMDVWDDSAAKECLGIPDDCFTCETEKQINDIKQNATEQFFTLFSKWFWDMWD